jgi:hypothetical protein
MDAWFQRACAREPSERFASVDEMIAAFAVAAGLRAPGNSVVAADAQRGPPLTAAALPTGVDGATADQTAAPFSVTEPGIPKRSVAVPVAVAAGVVALAGALVVTRLLRTSSDVPAPEPATATSATHAATAAPASMESTTAVVESSPSPPAGRATTEAVQKERPKVTVAASPPHAGASPSPAKPAAQPATAKPVATKPEGAAPHPAKPLPAQKPSVDLGF